MMSSENQALPLNLSPVLDLVAAPGLLEIFVQSRGNALLVEGSNVQRLGAQCLQILLSARAAWAADKRSLVIANCSDEFLVSLDLMGVAPESLSYRKEST